jgi:hypothetical protein
MPAISPNIERHWRPVMQNHITDPLPLPNSSPARRFISFATDTYVAGVEDIITFQLLLDMANRLQQIRDIESAYRMPAGD